METDGEGGGGEAEKRGRTELGRLLEAIGSSEVLEKRVPLIKQLEELPADDLGLILQGLLASWIDSTCSGVSHCALHRLILQVALKCSDLDITDYLGQFLTLSAKASSWCVKHNQWSVKSADESEVVQEEEHNRLRLEVNSLSFSISTKLRDIAAKCITALRLEVAEEERALNKALNEADDAFPTLEAARRCMHCGWEETTRWRQGADGPGTLCSACGQPFLKRRCSSKESSATSNDMAALVEAPPCDTSPLVSWEEAGPASAEEELEWLLNKDTFLSVKTIAVEEAPALVTQLARTKRQWSVKVKVVSLSCTHCGTEETPLWREGPEGPRTLCNACGVVFKRKGRLLPEYRPANSPAFSPQLHSNSHRRALQMHSQNGPTSSSSL